MRETAYLTAQSLAEEEKPNIEGSKWSGNKQSEIILH